MAVADLSGRVALVTGAAAGIGYAFAEALAAAGAAVAIADLHGAGAAAERLIMSGARACGLVCDVSDEEDVERAVKETAALLGGPHVLVNNAALFSALAPGPFTDITAADWQRVMAVNTLGPFLLARAAVPLMRAAGGGRIVNVASNTVHKGAPGLLHYVSSKGAVIAMTRALARELGSDGITVNAIAPGFTLSEGTLGNAAYQEAFRASAADARAIRRDQLPADLTGAVVFLASDAAAFVTGQTLVVDGGNVFA